MLSETVSPAVGRFSLSIIVPTRRVVASLFHSLILYNSAGVHHVIGLWPLFKGEWVTDLSDSMVRAGRIPLPV